MDRRKFIRAAAISAGFLAGGNYSKLFSGSKDTENLSLEIICDNSSKAIKLAEEYFKYSGINSLIKYSESMLNDSANGDIVLISQGKLVNYKLGLNSGTAELREIASELNLPRVINNPVRLSFKIMPENTAAENFLIFKKDKLIYKIKSSEKDHNINISGSKSQMTVNINNGRAKVVSSGCTHQNCVNSGSISGTGESLVCIPNEIHIIAE